MTTKKKTTTAPLPLTDGSLSKQQFIQALADAGHTPEQVWEGEAGVKLRGPCFRPATDEHGMVVRVRRYYRGTFEEPLGSGLRQSFEERIKTLGLKEARRIDQDLEDGLSSKEAARRTHVWALGDNLGLVVERMWLRKVKRPTAAHSERAAFERFRWSTLPKVAAGGAHASTSC